MTTIATFGTHETSMLVRTLKTGAGPALLEQLDLGQRRQTDMALFTLIEQLINIRKTNNYVLDVTLS